MWINRELARPIHDRLIDPDDRKILVIFGPRQVGKTSLIEKLIKEIPLRSLSITADEVRVTEVLSSRDLRKIRSLVEGYQLLFIDEAQRIPDIGINLKLIYDHIPGLKVITTGSSSFELARNVHEPLTGRVWTYTLYPVSQGELLKNRNQFELTEEMESYLVYGSYPGLLGLKGEQEKIRYLRELTSSYLFKDILELANIRHSAKLKDLLRLVSFQIGSELSHNELGTQLGMSKDTVASYLDLLEKTFVLFRLSGYSRNLRKEISRMDKFYFYDLGIRNALIDNFNSLEYRNDGGHLWENFLMVERLKNLSYMGKAPNRYFWRTYTGAELDYIEESGGKLCGYEFIMRGQKVKAPAGWLSAYPGAEFQLISRENYLGFITE